MDATKVIIRDYFGVIVDSQLKRLLRSTLITNALSQTSYKRSKAHCQ